MIQVWTGLVAVRVYRSGPIWVPQLSEGVEERKEVNLQRVSQGGTDLGGGR